MSKRRSFTKEQKMQILRGGEQMVEVYDTTTLTSLLTPRPGLLSARVVVLVRDDL